MRLALCCCLLLACASDPKADPSPVPPPTNTVTKPTSPPAPQQSARVHIQAPGGELAINVEVVSTAAKIERGLMYREHLAPDAGMLFLMGHERDWSFWMRNTLIPLDIIFIKKDFTIAGIAANARPKDETLLRVGVPSLYVLEVNAGWAKAHNVTPGTAVRFENVATP